MQIQHLISTVKFRMITLFILSTLALKNIVGQSSNVYYNSGPNLTNLIYSRSEPIITPCGAGERVTTFDINGRKVSEKDWYNGKMCGKIKVYLNGVLQKEITMYYNIILDYTFYENGIQKVKINEERTMLVRNGLPVKKTWDNIFITLSQNKLIMLTRKEFLDLACLVMMPEEAVEIMQGINDNAGSSIPESNKNILMCGGSFSAMPNTDLKAGLRSTNSSTRTNARDILNSTVNTCSQNIANFNGSNFNGLSGPSAKSARIAAANTALDNIISKCEAQKDDNSLIATDAEDQVWQAVRPYIGPSLPVLREAARGAASGELTVGRVVLKDAITISYNTAKVSLISSTPATGTATAGALATSGVLLLGALAAGVGIGTIIEKATSEWTTQLIDEHFNAKEKAAEASAQQNSAPANTNSGTPQNSGSTQGPGTKLVMPDAGNKCDRLKSMRDRCNANGWQTMECQDFTRIFAQCGSSVDPREVYTSGDGSFIGGMCTKLDKEDAQKLKCDKLGMIALVPPGGNILCSINKNFFTDQIISNPKEKWWTDPVPQPLNSFRRSNLAKYFDGKKNVTVYDEITAEKLSETLKKASKQTFVVFLDPDCPSCIGFINTLVSKEVENEIQNGINLIVVDAGANPNLQSKYPIMVYPSYFVRKSSGEMTPMAVGSMGISETIRLMRIK